MESVNVMMDITVVNVIKKFALEPVTMALVRTMELVFAMKAIGVDNVMNVFVILDAIETENVLMGSVLAVKGGMESIVLLMGVQIIAVIPDSVY